MGINCGGEKGSFGGEKIGEKREKGAFLLSSVNYLKNFKFQISSN